jgi:SAM-dependent methyltransferase
MVASRILDALVKNIDDWFDNVLVEPPKNGVVTQSAGRADDSRFVPFKALRGLANGAIDCLLAHWYLLPGLQFQRFRVLLGMSSVLRRKHIAQSTLARILDEPPQAVSYLGFDFAWKALSARTTLGRYLDVSSPWLFPVALLSRCNASSATLVSSEAEALRDLLGAAKATLRDPAGEQSADDESYDTVTSLSWLERVHDDVKAVARLWRILRPGGTLLVSLSCARDAVEEWVDAPAVALGSEDRRVLWRRLYDVRLLNGRIFEVTGLPKRYAIYGERNSISDNGCRAPKLTGGFQPGWRPSMIIGRDWRSYSSVRELPGQGVIAMKFVKPENGRRAARQFSLHLD